MNMLNRTLDPIEVVSAGGVKSPFAFCAATEEDNGPQALDRRHGPAFGSTSLSRMGLASALVLALLPAAADAHVKWFAPYMVGDHPQPIGMTLSNLWFWIGIALVVGFFIVARQIERSALGGMVLDAMDRAMSPLTARLDDFVRATTGAFFIAIFAVGGIYLTPDLQTPSPWVSWAQLIIAACVFTRPTMPLAAAGIMGLWMLALRDYDLFHLLDYVALGVGTAAYLVLASSRNEDWRRFRFQALRWAVAIALMWSSLEKFAYPEWFYPVIEEKPFLTFGLPQDVFIPMAGVVEFTLGLGLLWTPLIRRLSAVALLVIFNAAVIPFGRIDLVGHALIMTMIVTIAADPMRGFEGQPLIRRGIAAVPVSLTAALVLFAGGYWGLHAAVYNQGRQGFAIAVISHLMPEAHHGGS